MKQAGIAFIMSLLVVALAAAIATFLLAQQNLWARQVENLNDQAQAASVARAAINWARFILAEDKNESDHVQEAWAEARAGLPLEGAKVSLVIADAQALFNLNNLVRDDELSEKDVQAFQRLLASLNLPPDLALAAADSVDENSDALYPGGAEDLDYLAHDPPYRAPNRAFLDVHDLTRVKGFTPEMVLRLEAFVTALPEPTLVNVNTAPPEILAAVIPEMSMADAGALIEMRKNAPFESVEEMRAQFPQLGDVSQISLGVASQHFKIFVRAEVGRARANQTALVARAGELPQIIWKKTQ
jgi:general secretion pathway protein K